MKEYCVDLEIAKELKENGFHKDCKFSWVMVGEGDSGIKMDIRETTKNPLYVETNAPISDEILKELPEILEGDALYYLDIIRVDGKYSVSYGFNDIEGWIYAWEIFKDPIITDKKLSNALAKIWLYLKKEGYIK